MTTDSRGTDGDTVVLRDGDVEVTVAPRAGGRVASIRVSGTEVLVTGDGEPDMRWGSYPMTPWAGRVRHGTFDHDGTTYRLPLDMPPHAIHGTTYTRPWTVTGVGPDRLGMRIDLGDQWPLGGAAEQMISVSEGVVRCDLAVTAADRSMPAQVGWHPWFRKPRTARLRFGGMYVRDEEGIPTGEIVPPPPGPWDDCFVEPRGELSLVVPGIRSSPDVEVVIASDCDHWVVYDMPDHATCVEPQSGPPDGFTLAPHVLAPGRTLRRWMTITVATR